MTAAPESRSPWSALAGVTEAEVAPVAAPVTGEIAVPGSKSVTNRVLILAAAARGRSVLTGILRSDDSYWCIDALRRLGVAVEVADDRVTIEGTGGDWPAREGELFIGSAGTIARFLPGILAAASSGRWRLRGSEQLTRRPVDPMVEVLKSLGAGIGYAEGEGRLPLAIEARGIEGGRAAMSGTVSSQFISGVLMAAPLSRRGVELEVTDHIVQQDYVAITLDAMRDFGAEAEVSDDFRRFVVPPRPYRGRELAVEADASTTTYFLALAAATRGRIRVTNIGYGTRQPDIRFLDVLERMGCRVERGAGHVAVEGPERLTGGFEVDMRPMSDATLTLAAIAPFADAPIAIRNVAHIRRHESDRIRVACEALAAMDVPVEEHEDGLTVHPGTPRPAVLDTHDDHRVAMSMAVTGAAGSGVALRDPGCVSKTCPVFFEAIARLGVGVTLR